MADATVNRSIELSQVYHIKKSDQDIMAELMEFRVTELLLIASHYDAYAVVREGRFFDKINGDFLQLNLVMAPHITIATNQAQATEMLTHRQFDMVIVIAGIDRTAPLEMARQIKRIKPELPILLMVQNAFEFSYYDYNSPIMEFVERVFVWNGDTMLFLAMIKYIEDKRNIAKDTQIGNVRVIMLVEDSPRFYSKYLPLLYSIVLRQTQEILAEERSNQIHKLFYSRVRPKIILVSNYEEAIRSIDLYADFLIGVIADVSFPKQNEVVDGTGFELLNYVHKRVSVPFLMQSSDVDNRQKATAMHVDFVDKTSEFLSQEVEHFIHYRLGFGDFEFLSSQGQLIAKAHTMHEFEEAIRNIPPSSLLFHAKRNAISTWLMARAEITLAKELRNYGVDDFESVEAMRTSILKAFELWRVEQTKGKVLFFDANKPLTNRFINRIGQGSLGGKGRGIAFLSNLIENIDFQTLIPDFKIEIPLTLIIGTADYLTFMEKNRLMHWAIQETDFQSIQQRFLDAHLPDDLEHQLLLFLKKCHNPLAVRSSGLFEDDLLQPFSGVYSTFLVANNQSDLHFRLQQLSMAIKMVYASIFSPTAKNYFSAVNYKIEEEQMAVVVQQLVGNQFENRFYPTISGVAQSFNYYPFSYMTPEDGFATMAVGLGKYVAGGEPAWRFSPAFPHLDNFDVQDQLRYTQKYFYAFDSNTNFSDNPFSEDSGLLKLPIADAEQDGSLTYSASVYDARFQSFNYDFSQKGIRVVNFASILKFDKYPLAQTLRLLLDLLAQALGSAVEIEFSFNIKPDGTPRFYLLQVKPLNRNENPLPINWQASDNRQLLLSATHCLGNGTINHIHHIIYVDLTNFDISQSSAMALELAELNAEMENQGKDYILIGPGRWGSRDASLGIPVVWSQISRAKAIVEIDLPDFQPEASMGSHFFHHIISMNVGYITLKNGAQDNFIDFSAFDKMKLVSKGRFLNCVYSENPFLLLMDAKQQMVHLLK